ncbi:hypothetical protein RRSWK_01931 [Rhodopirellula sp. SWK7]|nr:hypothetical protein RRSWK_01931 [Rhodopirellula sp. SWK7]
MNSVYRCDVIDDHNAKSLIRFDKKIAFLFALIAKWKLKSHWVTSILSETQRPLVTEQAKSNALSITCAQCRPCNQS